MNNETHMDDLILTETHLRHLRHRARIAYSLIWMSSMIAMFIAVAFMLLITDVNPKNLYFYIPVAALAAIMAIAIPLTAKIAKHYN